MGFIVHLFGFVCILIVIDKAWQWAQINNTNHFTESDETHFE